MSFDLIFAYGQHCLYSHFGLYLLDSPGSLKDCFLMLLMLERRIGSRRKRTQQQVKLMTKKTIYTEYKCHTCSYGIQLNIRNPNNQ